MNDDSSAAHHATERLEKLIHEHSPEALSAAAASPDLGEDLALGLLTRRDLPGEVLEAVSKNAAAMKSRKVMLMVVAHPRTPRHVSLPATRRLYTFELMSLALMPALAGDLKIAVEETIITRMDTISAGERLTLAKRGPGRVAAALLTDPEARVIEAALANPFLREAAVVKALVSGRSPQPLAEAVCTDQKWSVRREVRMALLRNEHTPLARAIIYARPVRPDILREVLQHSRLKENVKRYLLAQLEEKSGP